MLPIPASGASTSLLLHLGVGLELRSSSANPESGASAPIEIEALIVLDYPHGCRRAGRRLDTRANRRGGTHPVNPLPAKRIPAQIRSLCRAYTDEAVRSLAAIMRNPDAPPRARIRAADMLLDRGWGKPQQGRGRQEHPSDNQENLLRAAIRIDVGLPHNAGRPARIRCGWGGISSPEALSIALLSFFPSFFLFLLRRPTLVRAGRTSSRYGNQSKVTRTERRVFASSIAITPASCSQAKARYFA
jgi:hypothetical protein